MSPMSTGVSALAVGQSSRFGALLWPHAKHLLRSHARFVGGDAARMSPRMGAILSDSRAPAQPAERHRTRGARCHVARYTAKPGRMAIGLMAGQGRRRARAQIPSNQSFK